MSRSRSAFVALIKGRTISPGTTFLSRIPMSVPRPTRTPENSAVIQSPIGTKYRITPSATSTAAAITTSRNEPKSIETSPVLPDEERRKNRAPLDRRLSAPATPHHPSIAVVAHHFDRLARRHVVPLGDHVDT